MVQFYSHRAFSMYWKLMYGAPWIRCQVYVIGMLVGYFLRSRKHLKIHPVEDSLQDLLTDSSDRQHSRLAPELCVNGDCRVLPSRLFRRQLFGPWISSRILSAKQASLGTSAFVDYHRKLQRTLGYRLTKDDGPWPIVLPFRLFHYVVTLFKR